MRWIGIDPGLSGAVAALDPDTTARIVDCPQAAGGRRFDEPAMLAAVRDLAGDGPAAAVIEQITLHKGPRRAGLDVLLISYGLWRMALTAAGVPYHIVRPVDWMEALFGPGPWEKRRSVDYCQAMYPDAPLAKPRGRVPNHNRADALCLAAFGRLHLGRPPEDTAGRRCPRSSA